MILLSSSRSLRVQSLILMGLVFLTGALHGSVGQTAQAEAYHSRLNSLLLKKNNVYLPTRLVLGEEAKFVVKAPAGSLVKVLLSTQSSGYTLPSGTSLRVGKEVQELSGTVPENGVLELKMGLPNEENMAGRVVYVDAAAGSSEETLTPMDLVDSMGHRTDENRLVIVKPAELGGPNIMPNLPGLSPQLFNQITNMSNAYSQGGNAKELLDTGDINRDRAIDKNPFVNRGAMPGLK